MPKRTKKEKIIAEYRRKLQAVGASQNQALPRVVSQNRESSYQLKPTGGLPAAAQVNSAFYHNDLVAIRHDLSKTIGLAAVTISLELLLYWQLGR